MLSQTAEYALRAVLHLAEGGEGAQVPVGRIAEELDVPQNYLSKILHVLAREEVLSSMRGPGGGFRLGAPAEELTLASVVEPFDRLGERSRCLLGRERCGDEDPCPAHARWKHIAGQVRDFFERTTVAELLKRKAVAGAAPVEADWPD